MSRRDLIADAAISTLARDGMRGLTHRAVDRTAGLPEGSASYYFRTRQALLQATVERLAELTGADMLASAALMDSPVSESPVSESPVAESPVAESPVAESPVAESPVAESPVVDSAVVDIAVLSPAGDELNAFGALAAALVESWLTAGRERQLARYELSLEATRRPELRQTLVTTGAAIRAVIAGRFAAAGVPEPAQRAADFAAFIDGLLFDQIAGAGNRKLTTRDVRAAIGTFLAGVTGSRP
jgi:AcrR family transcriptional regulator